MRKILKGVMIFVIAAAVIVLGINFIVVGSAGGDIAAAVDSEDVSLDGSELAVLKDQNADCILILGAGVRADGSPTLMLKDRLDVGLYLYKQGVSKKLLLSGDNGQIEYNEVKCMKEYMIDHGVKGKDIFLDHAGFSTYETMYRAGAIFDVKNAVVVTQGYHEYRALYIGKKLGMTVSGVAADQKRYGGQTMRDLREVVARDKDFVKCIYKPEPTYLGDSIPITGDGRESW
ncbi:MAG: ElyC/SanA/YdcF family protein [Eubacteriaceae bacterium]|nr:ElyC/SanA/YdcF family protein [Eubacteriaceae bacterium]